MSDSLKKDSHKKGGSKGIEIWKNAFPVFSAIHSAVTTTLCEGGKPDSYARHCPFYQRLFFFPGLIDIMLFVMALFYYNRAQELKKKREKGKWGMQFHRRHCVNRESEILNV